MLEFFGYEKSSPAPKINIIYISNFLTARFLTKASGLLKFVDILSNLLIPSLFSQPQSIMGKPIAGTILISTDIACVFQS